MIIARFEFKPESASHYIRSNSSHQNVIECEFDNVLDLIATTKEFENDLVDCTAIVDGQVFCLSEFANA